MGGVEGGRRIHLVGWEGVCLPVDKGGLGIKNLADFNTALLYKWRWRILEGKNELWLTMLDALREP